MRHWTLLAAASLILCNFLADAVPTPTEQDIATLTSRRINNIIDIGGSSADNVNKWKSSLRSSGTWSDVDYTAGCDARVASWPAQTHLTRTRSLAAAYAKNTTDTALLTKTIRALNYWLDNDFTTNDCIDWGGNSAGSCPCGTPGLWNPNWYNQIIGTPTNIGGICLLLQQKLTPDQLAACSKIQARSYATIDTGLRTFSSYTGANLLDVASIGITLGLLNKDANTLKDALEDFYRGVEISDKVAGDGIQSDGSFMQHAGLLYNGNYGKDYINDLLSVFIETKETELAPPTYAQFAFETLMSGSEWMMIADTKLKSLLWQYSVIGRMISFRYSDNQASGGVAIDINKVEASAEGWEKEADVVAITDRLQAPSTDDANQGDLVGTRYFYNSDYMVHRGPTYVVTMKMYSTRTINSECINSQNIFGFHLSDGAIHNYLTGDEYVDTFGAWDWDLVPGITVDYGGTPLQCSKVKSKGKKDFVGGATDGNTGVAVMDYVNPQNGNLAFKKTVFFFPSGYAVQVGPVTSKNTAAPLVTVLDQRRRNGDIYVSGSLKNTDTTYATSKSSSIWHDRIGYYFPTSENLYVNSRPKASNWSAIGISEGTETQQLWTSYIKHTSTNTTGLLTQYIVQPDVSASTFNANVAGGNMPIALAFNADSPQVNAAYSAADKSIAAAFWTAGTYATPWNSVTMTVDNPCIFTFRETKAGTYRLTVADPTQSLVSVKLTIKIGSVSKSTTVTLPTGVTAGRYVVKTMVFSS
ncbi:polysaccharide lyase family 8 protein [Mucor lusitanicus]|uniref:Polysaccharide lyase family 8 protein n=2 Tax=Mucor circinelloides f. lusitanicus TaxID=29924 RepID=A0A162YMR5_MUCCL|nr:polysaccharide lyase family 8 protein [Mucor lusitanicus]OAC99536.1 polysaccharide lyase family 8 protein [Mucor lusitanicus CBS 277.49]